MTIPQSANTYTLGGGTSPSNVPVVQNRAPTIYDINYPVGKEWVWPLNGSVYFLAALSGNPVQANWVAAASASGALNTLSDGTTTVNPTAGNIEILGTANQITSTGSNAPGAITLSLPSTMIAPGSLEVTGLLTGDASATINTAGTALNLATDNDTAAVNIGNGTSARTISIGTTTGVKTIALGGTSANVITIGNTQTAGSVAIGAAMTTGTISIGGTGLQTGTITVGGGTGAQTVNLATGGTGVKTVHIADSAVANVITMGSLTGAASLTLQSGTGGISLATGATSPGAVSITPNVVSAAALTVVNNARVGQAVFTGQTTASGATDTYTITNSVISGTTQALIMSCDNLGTNDAQMTITRVKQSAGSIAVQLKNNGAAALNGDVHLTFWVLN